MVSVDCTKTSRLAFADVSEMPYPFKSLSVTAVAAAPFMDNVALVKTRDGVWAQYCVTVAMSIVC